MKASDAGLSEAAKDYIDNTIGNAAQDLKDNAALYQDNEKKDNDDSLVHMNAEEDKKDKDDEEGEVKTVLTEKLILDISEQQKQ